MAGHKVVLVATQGTFRGLAKQNMLFHQCIGELIDNAIAASREDQKFRVEVIFIKKEEDSVDVYVADNCRGMTLGIMKKALQLGESATTDNRLNEHGFGMKNALATLSGENGWWKIWTKPVDEDTVYTAEGPFGPEMYVRDDEAFPEETFLPSDISTLIKVPVRLSFVQTVQGRGAPAKDLALLREWLIEHLGVLYRGYLEQDPRTYENSGVIVVSIVRDRVRVPPIPVPLGNMVTKYLEIEIGGEVVNLEYRYGALDEVKRDNLVRGQKAKYYYQGNQPTQGIDIRLGKRVIATMQFQTIWKHPDGDRQLSRHNRYNDFLGELRIPELPRGILTTVNNKTDFNLDDPDWVKMFDKLNEIRPIENIRERSESALRKKWMSMLRATNPEDTVTDERCVWPTGTRIDVYRKMADGKIVIYEMKTGTGSPIHLYQLKMYWDGLVLGGEQPREAILLVEDFNTTLEEMVNIMNQLTPPNNSEPYDFRIEKHEDKGL
jgi:hypothetical protein